MTTNSRYPCILIAAASMMLFAASATAQQPLNLQLPEPRENGAQISQDVSTPQEYSADTATSVHGSFTTGIGYSKTYGNSTLNEAELDVNKRYDDGKSLNLHIDVLHGTGIPGGPPRDYVSRYPGY